MTVLQSILMLLLNIVIIIWNLVWKLLKLPFVLIKKIIEGGEKS